MKIETGYASVAVSGGYVLLEIEKDKAMSEVYLEFEDAQRLLLELLYLMYEDEEMEHIGRLAQLPLLEEELSPEVPEAGSGSEQHNEAGTLPA